MQAKVERLERLVDQLQREVRELREALGVNRDEFELVSEAAPAPGSYSATPVSTPTRATATPVYPLQGPGPAELHSFRAEATAPVLPRTDRDNACREIGLWILRALSGNHRGASGRDKLTQASRFWVVFRTFEGSDCNPPRAFSALARAKTLCKRNAECGASVFVGLPARADVEAVCSAAGFPTVSFE